MTVRLYDTRHKAVVDIVPARAGRLTMCIEFPGRVVSVDDDGVFEELTK